MTTLSDIKKLYPDYRVSQIGSKQLFIVHKGAPLLLSYYTTIGIRLDGVWNITTKRYSRTTTKQITQFSNDRTANRTVVRITQEELEQLLAAH